MSNTPPSGARGADLPSGDASEGPTPFGPYMLMERIGLGGMAEIWRARKYGAAGFERPLVVKKLLKRLAHTPSFIRMFIDEAKLAVSLQHPNVVHVYDLGEVDHTYFIAMEYVSGRDLLNLLVRSTRQRTRIPVHLAVHIAAEVLKALDAAHNAVDRRGNPLRIIHRDVSPSNVLLGYTGVVKLSDFGVARALEAHPSMAPAPDQRVRGKLGYMSPEQAARKTLDPRSDLFCVAILLYEMLAMNRLFRGADDEVVRQNIEICDIEPAIRALPSDVPDALKVILRQALQRDPDDRYPTAIAFLDALLDHQFRSGHRVGSGDVAALMDLLFGDELAAERARQDTLDDLLLERFGGPPSHKPTTSQEMPALQPNATPTHSLPGEPPVFSGSFDRVDVPRMLYRYSVAGLTGRLRLLSRGGYQDVYWHRGRPEHVAGGGPESRLGALLQQNRVVDSKTLQAATAMARREGLRLGDALLRLGRIPPESLYPALQSQARWRLLNLFTWSKGRYAFFRDDRPEGPIVPLDMDPWALIADGIRHRIDLGVVKGYLEKHNGSMLVRCQHHALSIDDVPLSDAQRRIWSAIRPEGPLTLQLQWAVQAAEGDEREALRTVFLMERLDFALLLSS
ncbi:MAG: protein kinase domain-containing protein [Bradymonadia bacterium]